jgi:RNase H-like domain found in reverse transcriptase/Integrase zinc binding domain
VGNMTVYMERVIAYWSRSLKSAEQNYSATEREALGVKEALVHFQPFIEGEKNIMIMDHTALQWARTYENANRRLMAWGAVFAAYPGLDIVHRAGIVHSNVDPLLRLPQILPHQSPVEDKSPALLSPLTAQPIFAWEDIVERKPAERAAFFSTRMQSKKQGILYNQKDLTSAIDETEQAARKRARARNPPSQEYAPRTLDIEISPHQIEAFMQGYQMDPSFRQAWNEAPAEESELLAAQRFYKSEKGLLIFRDTDWVARLCVPKSEVRRVLKESHELSWETTHAGSSRLFHKLADQFYWPRMWADVVDYIKTCDVCQKIKTDKQGPIGKLCPHTIPLLPFEVVMLDLITGLPKSEGHNAILVIMDKLTKFVQYIPTTLNLKQEGFAKLFVQHLILRYGLPRQMIAD